MAIFAVISFDDAEELRATVRKHYPDSYIPDATPNLTFVRCDDTAANIARVLGMDNDGKKSGVVVKREYWNGYAETGLWEWGNQGE